MNVRPSLAWLAIARVVLSSLLIASCGGKSSTSANTSVAGAAAMSAGGASNSGGSAGQGVTSTATCPAPEPVAPSSPNQPPSAVGCYVYTGGGWQQTPCNCDLWLKNPVGGAVAVKLALLFSPPDMVPSLTGLPDVEIKFQDADESWFEVWAAQATRDASFSVTKDSGFTTVRFGASIVNLDPVWLAGCESRSPTGSVSAPYGTPLDLVMQATLTDIDGNSVGRNVGECSQPESHPTFRPGGSGGEASDAGPPQ